MGRRKKEKWRHKNRIGPDNEESTRKGRQRDRGKEKKEAAGREMVMGRQKVSSRVGREGASPPKAPWLSFPQHQFLQLGPLLAPSTSSTAPIIPHSTHTSVWIPFPLSLLLPRATGASSLSPGRICQAGPLLCPDFETLCHADFALCSLLMGYGPPAGAGCAGGPMAGRPLSLLQFLHPETGSNNPT